MLTRASPRSGRAVAGPGGDLQRALVVGGRLVELTKPGLGVAEPSEDLEGESVIGASKLLEDARAASKRCSATSNLF